MAKRIFITATNTDIGKTYTTKLLMKALTQLGYKVGVVKPIETGVISEIYPDGDALLELLKQLNPHAWSLGVEDVVPVSYELPAAPYISSNFGTIDYEQIEEAIKAQENICDVLLIEGAGGLFVPVDKDTMMIDLIKRFDASAVLVTHCVLGCINDTVIHKQALEDRGIETKVAFNCKEGEYEAFKEISLQYFEKHFTEYFFTSEIEKLAQKLV